MQLGMRIENRQWKDGPITISEYRFTPVEEWSLTA
jgi:hypothetical protein